MISITYKNSLWSLICSIKSKVRRERFMKSNILWVIGSFFLSVSFLSPFLLNPSNDSEKSLSLSSQREEPLDVILWAEFNIRNMQRVDFEKREPIYYIINKFYSRLVSDKYNRCRKNDLTLVILKNNQKLTDFPRFKDMVGKTIEQLLGYPGDDRLIGEVRAVGGYCHLFIGKELLTRHATRTYNLFYHEFAHFILFSLLTDEEVIRLEQLYEIAKQKGLYLDDYAAVNPSEYFAQAFEAYFSVSKSSILRILQTMSYSYLTCKYCLHTKEDLEQKDPEMVAFIESLRD